MKFKNPETHKALSSTGYTAKKLKEEGDVVSFYRI